jgi:hypothetical protein
VSAPKKRPGTLWMLFYGRQRRGFPWLLAWVGIVVLLGAVAFGLAGGPEGLRLVLAIFAVALIGLALVVAIVAPFIPRRRR